jgi:hypothetical protein
MFSHSLGQELTLGLRAKLPHWASTAALVAPE